MELKAEAPFQTASSLYARQRSSPRYKWLPGLRVEATYEGRPLVIKRLPGLENISAGGLCVSVGEPRPPVGAELEFRFPLVEGPFDPARLTVRCRGRVLRHETLQRVAVQFHDVQFVRQERPARLPAAAPTAIVPTLETMT
ncbi:MAG: PilZ domain-containing protein [Acidobacteria bacterium]|nr:PilZ domain-containing protein [Acidobacteriota bacterium]